MTAESLVQLDTLPTSQPRRPAVAEVVSWSLGVLLGLLSLSAAVVVWRRVVGALTSPLTPSMLLTVGLMVVITAFCIRLLGRRFFTRGSTGHNGTHLRQFRRLVSLLPSASVVAMGISLSLPGTFAGGLWAFWALLVAEECWAGRPALLRLIRRRWDQRKLGAGDRGQGTGNSEPQPGFNLQSAIASSVLPCPHPDPLPRAAAAREGEGTVLQQLTRSQAADGSEELSGWVRVLLAAGQRTGNVHLAFCPPFVRTPEFAVEQVEGPRCRVKTVQLLPYGARLELKLAVTADSVAGVLLQFSARATGA